jgi:hypothetical protein
MRLCMMALLEVVLSADEVTEIALRPYAEGNHSFITHVALMSHINHHVCRAVKFFEVSNCVIASLRCA